MVSLGPWSEPHSLTSGHHLEVGDRPGVYRIRAFASTGEPLAIPRAADVDVLGILHIGKSITLGKRLRVFRQAAEGLNAPHHAGKEFKQWGFARSFPFVHLKFDYLLVDNGAEALKLERQLHEEYRQRYLDRPPLDSQSGQMTSPAES